MSATNYFPPSQNTIFAPSNNDKRKHELRKFLFFPEELYQRVQAERNNPTILVDVINEFASLEEDQDVMEEVAPWSKTKKKKKKKTTARKTRTTNRKKMTTMEKKMKKDWIKLKTKTTKKKRKTQQMRNLRLMRAGRNIQLVSAGSERRRTCYYAMGSPLVTLGIHLYKFLSCASVFQFYSISIPWLHDDPLTKGHWLLVVLYF